MADDLTEDLTLLKKLDQGLKISDEPSMTMAGPSEVSEPTGIMSRDSSSSEDELYGSSKARETEILQPLDLEGLFAPFPGFFKVRERGISFRSMSLPGRLSASFPDSLNVRERGIPFRSMSLPGRLSASFPDSLNVRERRTPLHSIERSFRERLFSLPSLQLADLYAGWRRRQMLRNLLPKELSGLSQVSEPTGIMPWDSSSSEEELYGSSKMVLRSGHIPRQDNFQDRDISQDRVALETDELF